MSGFYNQKLNLNLSISQKSIPITFDLDTTEVIAIGKRVTDDNNKLVDEAIKNVSLIRLRTTKPVEGNITSYLHRFIQDLTYQGVYRRKRTTSQTR
jgi:hypothetical protein